jgi:hypothetical protein
MAATVEVNYFNSFWLKKVVRNGATEPEWPGLPWNPYGYFELAVTTAGTGYSVTNNVDTTSIFLGAGLVVDITSVNSAGGITGVKMVSPGTNFVDGNVVTVLGGSGTAQLTISTILFPFDSRVPLTGNQNFYVEESRIKGGFNNTSTDLGVRAYSVNENRDKINRTHSLIFSGVYNNRTGFNETNVFSVSQAIIKDADPINGSIQKLYTEDTNLTVFQENKISKALINKSTIYSGEQGSEELLGIPRVLGQLVPYLGEYGISRNPESFAVYGYRKYFSDKDRSAILRLSRDGITEISAYGMRDYFRDYLATIDDSYNRVAITAPLAGSPSGSQTSFSVSSDCCNMEIGSELELTTATTTVTTNSIVTNVAIGSAGECDITIDVAVNFSAASYINANFVTYRKDEIIGAWDMFDQNYILSMQTEPRNASTASSTFNTLAFDEAVNGWTSFYSYKPVFIGSLKNKFYSFIDSNIYEHHYDNPPVYDTRCKFYGATSPEEASITLIFNPTPSITKNFNTIAYEGANGWQVDYFRSDYEGIDPNIPYTTPFSYTGSNQYRDITSAVKSYDEGRYAVNGVTQHVGFNRKENRYVANLISASTARPGEVIFGNQMSGIKGYIANVKFSTDTTTDPGGAKELFAVSSNYVLSSR